MLFASLLRVTLRCDAMRRDPTRPFVVTGEIFSVVPPERATPPLKRVSNVAGKQAEMHIGIFLLCNGYQRSDQSLVKMQVSTAAGKQAGIRNWRGSVASSYCVTATGESIETRGPC